MSSDDNNHLIRSTSLTNQYLKKDPIQSNNNIDDIDDINQQNNSSNNNLASKCSSSSKQSSRMASPVLSTSSHSSGRVITLLNHEVIQLPIDLEREINIKNNFDQLSKEK